MSKKSRRIIDLIIITIFCFGLLSAGLGFTGQAQSWYNSIAGYNTNMRSDSLFSGDSHTVDFSPTSLTLTAGQTGTFTVNSVSGSYDGLNYQFSASNSYSQSGQSPTAYITFSTAGTYQVLCTVRTYLGGQWTDIIYCSGTVTVNPVTYTISTSTSGGGSGSVSGGGQVAQGGSLTVSFSANSGSLIGVCSIDGSPVYDWYSQASGSYTFNDVQASHSMSIWFYTQTTPPPAQSYTVAVYPQSDESGSTSPYGSDSYTAGTQITLMAYPNSGYVFNRWSSGTGQTSIASYTSSPTTATVSGADTIIAYFTAVSTQTPTVPPTQTPTSPPTSTPTPTPSPTPIPQQALTVGTSGLGTITLTSNQGTVNSASGSYNYPQNTAVTLSASPGTNYQFSYWKLDDNSKIYSITTVLTLTQSRSALAVFGQIIPDVTPSPTPSGGDNNNINPTVAPTAAPEPTALPIQTPEPTLAPTEAPIVTPDYVDVNELGRVGGPAMMFVSVLMFLANHNLWLFKKH